MKADEFFHSMKTGNILSCYLFEGEEEYLKESALQQLRQKVLLPPFGDMNETVLNDPDAETLITVSETLPMMADKRLVVIRDSSLLFASREGAKRRKTRTGTASALTSPSFRPPPALFSLPGEKPTASGNSIRKSTNWAVWSALNS